MIIKVTFIDNIKNYSKSYNVNIFGLPIDEFLDKLNKYLGDVDWFDIIVNEIKSNEENLNIPTFLKYVDYNIKCGIEIPEYESEYM